MELFPASDATPWEIIQRVIDDSDYYLLVVGGMYGSTDSSGISYTEREYDYASGRGTPVLAFLHENPEAIPAGKTELQADARSKLTAFREKLQAHHSKYWRDPQDLQYKVAVGLVQEFNRIPATGWVRASELADGATTRGLANVQAATEEAALQRQLRDEAERRAQSLEEALATLTEQHTEAEDLIKAAGDREAEAIAKGREAHQALRPGERKSEHNPPESFAVEDAREVLASKRGLISAFVWNDTAQGHEFWSREQRGFDDGKPLSARARKTLEEWVKLESQSASASGTRRQSAT